MGRPKGSKNKGGFNIKTSEARKGEKNPNWKGNKVGYHGIHSWLRRNYGKPTKCKRCGHKGLCCEWSNKSGNYLRDINDWETLCPPCHRKITRNHKSKRVVFKKKFTVELSQDV